jgi:hypothetical protein
MTKVLSAKQKAEELGITLSGLAKTRHLYKNIKKSPRKYLYFAEEHRPNEDDAPDTLANSRSRVKRRGVPFGETNYSKAPSGSGSSLQLYNQVRSKMALEGKIPKKEQEAFTSALAHSAKKNYKEINEQRNAELTATLIKGEETTRKFMRRAYNPIVREPIRKYPYTMLSNAYPQMSYTTDWRADRQDDARSEERSWLDDIPNKKKYYY